MNSRKRGDRSLHPITGSVTKTILFGYLIVQKNSIFEIDERGKPDEQKKLASYQPGNNTPQGPVGIVEDEKAIINDKPYPIKGGQVNRHNERVNGIVLIDYTDSSAGP